LLKEADKRITELEAKIERLQRWQTNALGEKEELTDEIERLQALHLERTKSTHKALTQRDKENERLRDALEQIENLAPIPGSYNIYKRMLNRCKDVARKALKGEGDE